MIIKIKEILLEASRLDKVAKKHIKNGNPDKALNLYVKQNSNHNVNLPVSLEDRIFHLATPTSRMGATLMNFSGASDKNKNQLVDIYKNGSRKVKKFGLDNNTFKKPATKNLNNDIPKYSKDQTISFNHGGGKNYIDGLLSKNTLYNGYKLEHASSEPGIQVHPHPAKNRVAIRAENGYPKTALDYYGDYPATLHGKIRGDKVLQAPNNYEAGILASSLRDLKKSYVTDQPLVGGSINLHMEDAKIKHLIRTNKEINDKNLNSLKFKRGEIREENETNK